MRHGFSLSKFLQWRLNILLYLAFGWKMARIFIFLLGKLHFWFNKKERARIESALFEVIGSTNEAADVREVAKKVFTGILSHYYEKLFITFEEPRKASQFLTQNIISEDIGTLNRELLKGNGVIVVTGHYGAIEYIPTLLAIKGFPVSMIAKFKTEQLRKKTFAQAKKYNIRMIDAENTGSIIRSAINELRKNRVLVTECDEIEEWRPSGSERTSFLGRVTGLDRTINVIQKRTGADVVFGIIHRYSLSHYKLIMYSYEDMSRVLGAISPSSIGETVIKFLERHIHANPEQWYEWSKYFHINSATVKTKPEERRTSSPLFKPAFGKVS